MVYKTNIELNINEAVDLINPKAFELEKIQLITQKSLDYLTIHYVNLLKSVPQSFIINIYVTHSDEIQQINSDLRGKNQATDVLSINFDMVADELAPLLLEEFILGDIILCPQIIQQKALEYDYVYENHCVFLILHSLLHLLGLEHQEQEQREQMEQIETQLLNNLNLQHPF